MAGYILALEGVSLQAIRRGVTAALQGTGPFDPRFMPLAPELASYCRSLETADYEELARLRRQEDAAKLLPPPSKERSPEDQARIDALVHSAIRRMDEGRIEARNIYAPQAERPQKRIADMTPAEAEAHLREITKTGRPRNLALSDEARAAAGLGSANDEAAA